jgi:hypothetical protein
VPPFTRRDAGHDRVGGNVSGDHGAGSYESPRPDSNAAEDDHSGAEGGTALDHGSQEGPIGIALGSAFFGRCARKLVVDEENPMTDEDLVFDFDAVADEGVARDLASRADHRSALYLHERADARVVADPATVEVRE